MYEILGEGRSWSLQIKPLAFHTERWSFWYRHDYIVWKLCGALVTDATTASTTGLVDLSFQVVFLRTSVIPFKTECPLFFDLS
jgi:hypothetical protein